MICIRSVIMNNSSRRDDGQRLTYLSGLHVTPDLPGTRVTPRSLSSVIDYGPGYGWTLP
jgi:hypothetical protein